MKRCLGVDSDDATSSAVKFPPNIFKQIESLNICIMKFSSVLGPRLAHSRTKTIRQRGRRNIVFIFLLVEFIVENRTFSLSNSSMWFAVFLNLFFCIPSAKSKQQRLLWLCCRWVFFSWCNYSYICVDWVDLLRYFCVGVWVCFPKDWFWCYHVSRNYFRILREFFEMEGCFLRKTWSLISMGVLKQELRLKLKFRDEQFWSAKSSILVLFSVLNVRYWSLFWSWILGFHFETYFGFHSLCSDFNFGFSFSPHLGFGLEIWIEGWSENEIHNIFITYLSLFYFLSVVFYYSD